MNEVKISKYNPKRLLVGKNAHPTEGKY
jgi:hypothetical protein